MPSVVWGTKTAITFDVTALVQYTPNDMSQYELGYARKNRAPNLYERYTWDRRNMDMAMNGWFGDGNGYIGNINLEPKTAHTPSFTASLAEPQARLVGIQGHAVFYLRP